MKNTTSLHGNWRFALDEKGVGLSEKWHLQTLADNIQLPGILQAQGYGNPVSTESFFIHGLHDKLWFLRDAYKEHVQEGDVKVPFIAQPPRHYIGAAWYQTDIIVPQEWADKRITFSMERPKWKTHVWVGDTYFGNCDALCTEHTYDFGMLSPGKHVLTVMVDNSMIYPYRPDSHSISDSAGNSWNGIVGKIELAATGQVWFDRIDVYPCYKTKSAKSVMKLKSIGGKHEGEISVIAKNGTAKQSMGFEVDGEATVEITTPLGEDAQLWSEFNPALQTMEYDVYNKSGHCHKQHVIFGLRNIKAKGSHFMLNGNRVFMRGTNDHGCFPLTGYPATDIEEWRRIYSVCKEWGLNHIRYHSYCPPKAAFEAADELGMYLHIEPGGWNHFTPGCENEKHLHMESDRILKAYGNHASFVLFCAGNEPHGNWEPVLKAWVAKYREIDNRHLYATQCGRTLPIDPEPIDHADYHYTVSRGDMRARRQLGWFGKDFDHVFEGFDAPFLAHELGQHCAYPDFDVAEKFTGYLQPRYYEVFKASLEKSGMAHRNKDFTMASGMLQALCYKEEIEANMRTKKFSGFSLLDLHDYIGQCGALCGLVDAFWEEKPYISSEWFRRFNAPIVPLARVTKAAWATSEKFTAELEMACYAEESLLGATVWWRIEDENGIAKINGKFENVDIATGGNTTVGTIEANLNELQTGAYRLIVGVDSTEVENDWKIWVYASLACNNVAAVQICSDFAQAVELLKDSSNVLFIPPKENLGWNCPPIAWAPIFWNAQMGPNWCRPLGLWNDTSHPALLQFPTNTGMDWHWNDIVHGARAMNIGGLPAELQPFIQPIDDWNRNYKLALAFECKMYSGKMVVCSADLTTLAETSPVAAQLLHSIASYMASPAFTPMVEITEEHMQTFLFDTAIMQKLGATVKLLDAQELSPRMKDFAANIAVENIITGDANRYWLAGENFGGQYPFTLEFETPEPVKISGLCIMPRQNHRDMQGAPKGYEVSAFVDGEWQLQAKGELSASYHVQNIYLPVKVTSSKLRLKLLGGFGADDITYWLMHRDGHSSVTGNYHDPYCSLAQVAYITDADVAQSATIEYTDGRTATEEIY